MKKILLFTAAILAVCMGTSAFAAEHSNETDIELLSAMSIMQGDGNGFNGERILTREQLAKISVSVTEPYFTSKSRISPYSDVSYTKWSAPYIERASEKGYFSGYPDGSFHPEDAVSAEELCRVMLNFLGYDYTASAAGGWADAQLAAAEELGLLDGTKVSAGDAITRNTAARIIVNALLTQKSAGGYLIEDSGFGYFKDVVMAADKDSDYIATADGSFKRGVISDTDMLKKGDIVTDKSDTIVAFFQSDSSPAAEYDYIVKSVVSNGIAAFGENGDEFVEISGDTTVYEGSDISTFSQIKDGLEIGDRITIYKNGIGGIKYTYLTKDAISSPGHISEFNVSSDTKIIIDGESGELSDIDSQDICYYISETDTLLVYTKRVTGIYEKALPTKDNIETVCVSGNEYVIDGEAALRKLSSYGNISYGDAVTLMFGKDDTVVDVEKPEENSLLIGYLVDCALSEKEDKNGMKTSVYTAEVLLPDGTSNEYVSDKDYSGYECKAVKITFKDGKAHLTVLGTNKSVSGTYNRERGTLGKYTVADDVEIIDTAKNTYNKNTRGIGKKIFPQRLDGTSLTSDNILYASVTGNRITQLILNDCTGDIYSYGVVLEAENSSSDYSVSGSYEININGEIKSFSTSGSAFSVHKGDVIRCIEEDGTPIIMQPIGKYSERAAAVDNLYAYIGNDKYRLSDDVVVYRKIAGTESAVERRYEVISEDQLSSDDKLTAYYDKSEASGGRIRVIVAE